MRAVRRGALAGLLVVAWLGEAKAIPDPLPRPESEEPALPPDPPSPSEAELNDLYESQRRLEAEDRKQQARLDELGRMRWLSRYINVFVDVGAFAVAGDGSGIRPDIGHVYFPEYMDRVAGQWVFMGDPLSTAINSLGEPSDTASSREIEHDTINSRGRPSLIVNAIGVSISRSVTDHVSVAALAMLLPRPDENIVDIELAMVSYRPYEDTNFVIELGKIDSVLGIEYRAQDATKRKGVTPSLICRYTCGRPLGVRAQLVEGRLSASATLTNGDNFQQLFERDHMLTSSGWPTVSSHLQWTLPIEGLQVGVSGALGPQDGQVDPEVQQWHYGFDVRLLDFHDFDISAEFVQGKQPGQTEMRACDLAPCLDYKGAYLLVDRYITPKLVPYVRVDWRSAVHIKATEFVYESHTLRMTLGGQLEVTNQIIGKLEYTYNRELGGIPQFPNDVLTMSLVVKTD